MYLRAAAQVEVSPTRSVGSFSARVSLDLSLTGRPVDLQPRFQFPRRHVEVRRESPKHPSPASSNPCERQSAKLRGKVGLRRASVRRRAEHQRPADQVVFHKNTTNRLRPKKTPLVMSTMSLPGTGQKFHDQEDCQVLSQEAVDRLLGSHTRAVMSSGSLDGETTQYIQDTYDYLYNRHIQTLNGVINQHQQGINDSLVTNQQKLRIHCAVEQDYEDECLGPETCAQKSPGDDSESSDCSVRSNNDSVEGREPAGPLITFCHVAGTEEKLLASTRTRRSASPLLEVPKPSSNVDKEIKRPPIN